MQRAVHRRLQRCMLLLDYDARQAAQHDFDAAKLVDAAARAVNIRDPNANTLDSACELAELHAKLSA
jgi:hypothetical protein